MHITWIKDFFKWTNIKKGYEKQILDHNIEKFSLIVKEDIDMFSFIKILTEANKNVVLQFNSVSSVKNIMEDLKWHVGEDKHIRL